MFASKPLSPTYFSPSAFQILWYRAPSHSVLSNRTFHSDVHYGATSHMRLVRN